MLDLNLISEILKLDWNFRGADLIAIGLGTFAIFMTLIIYKIQNKTSKNIERLRKATIAISLGRITTSLDVIRESIDADIELVKIAFNEGENKIVLANKLMDDNSKFYSLSVENMTKETAFLKGQIEPLTVTEIEFITHLIKQFTTDRIQPNDSGDLEKLQIWYKKGQEVLEKIDEATKEVEKTKL